MSANLSHLNDFEFRDAWRNLPDAEKYALPPEDRKEYFERYQSVKLYTSDGVARAERAAAKLDEMRRAAPTPTESPQPLDWAELAKHEPPDRVWAIVMWIAMNVPTLLVGGGGTGKTLLLLQIGACLSLARRFVDDVPNRLRVLMWCCEDDYDELWRRMVRVAQWLGVGIADFTDHFLIVPRLGFDNTLYSSEFGRPMFTRAFEELTEQAGDYNVDVLLLDNSAQLFGGQENDRHQVTDFVNRLMGAHRDRAIVLAAHPSRQAGSEFSGSSAWENAVRTRLYLGRTMPDQPVDNAAESDEDVRYLARRKANYGPRDWRKLTLQNGVLIPEVVQAQGGLVGHLRDEQAERIVMTAITKLAAMGVHGTDSSNSPRFLPRLILDYKLGDGRSKAELGSATRRLMMEQKIARGTVGHYPNRAPKEGLKVA